jgi:hypothetical protein
MLDFLYFLSAKSSPLRKVERLDCNRYISSMPEDWHDLMPNEVSTEQTHNLETNVVVLPLGMLSLSLFWMEDQTLS